MLRGSAFSLGFSTSTSLEAGIVGLPNVGKSTLFNALIESAQAQAANFPFCTIEPNTGKVVVPDPTLDSLQLVGGSARVVPAMLGFVDIAGIVKGASKGEGLGNKFLENIRAVDAIIHVVRCFENEDVIHVTGKVNPCEDMETINLELILADIETCEKRLARLRKSNKANEKDPMRGIQQSALEKLLLGLSSSMPARLVALSEEEASAVKDLGLLTRKSVIYAANVADEDLASGNGYTEAVRRVAEKEEAAFCIVSAQVEAELVDLPEGERSEFLKELGVEESGSRSLIRKTFDLLGLQTFYTVGPEEVRAWTIKKGFTAPQAAGVIHSDLESSFIQAEVISWQELMEQGLVDYNKWGKRGKEYLVEEGDVIRFKSGLANKK